MHLVIEYKQQDFIGILVGFGGDLDTPDLDGNTPIMLAIKKDFNQGIQALIELGCDIDLQ